MRDARGGVEVQERMNAVLETKQRRLSTEDPIDLGRPRSGGEEVSHKLSRCLGDKTLKYAKTTRCGEWKVGNCLSFNSCELSP